MNEHTPTPWHWEIHDSSAASIHGPEGMMDHVLTVSPCKHCRGEEWVWGACTNPTEANAAFIVKAVNNHDALVEILRAINEVDAHGYAVAPMNYNLRLRVNAILDAVGGSKEP